MNAVIDTNILVDYAQTSKEAAIELGRYDKLFISRITWIEFLVSTRDAEEKSTREALLSACILLEIDPSVAAEAVSIRQTTRLKLPDAIILATARVHGLLLVTRNSKDFSKREPEVRILY